MSMDIGDGKVGRHIEKIVWPNLKFLAGDEPLDPNQSLGESGLDSLASINGRILTN